MTRSYAIKYFSIVEDYREVEHTDLMRKLEQFLFNVNEIGECSGGHSPK